MKIVKATGKDIPDLVFLNSFVQKIHADHHPEVFKSEPDNQELSRFFQEIIEESENVVFVAFVEEKAVGYLLATFGKRRENPFKYELHQAHIDQIVVQDGYRNQGIGDALVKRIEIFAREKGISRIGLDSWSFNEDAHGFFEKHGFSVYSISMWKTIKST